MATNDDLIYWKNQELPIKGQKFTDPIFPPDKKSLLGLDSNNKPIDPDNYKENNINSNDIEFKRPSEFFTDGKYDLFSEEIEIDDIKQGSLGNCYFLSAVANLSRFPELIMNLFKTKKVNEDGFYEIILYIDGIKQIVIVDDYIPVGKYTKFPCFAKPNKNKIWVMLLEKAWAKVNGGYVNTIGGFPCEAYEFLIGFGCLTYNFLNKSKEDMDEYKIEVIKKVKTANKNNCFISCSTFYTNDIEKVGLVPTHAYTLIDFNQIETDKGNVNLFRIRNPWSEGEWKGDWSDSSPLWNEKTKKQVKYSDKEDGIFFMNDRDFFKYFSRIEICNVIYNAKSITYTIEGEENLKNGIVFNIITEKEGDLNVSVLRKNWRAHRELKDKNLPTHISVVKYDPNQKNKLKVFTDYNGTYQANETCAINVHVEKGNYLIYVYRDKDHAEFNPDDILKVKIICSSEFKHAQMSYDKRDKGFPLLQNIIMQAEFIENNYDPDTCEDFKIHSTQLRGNGIGHIIYYVSNPGYFLDLRGSTHGSKNFIMLSPYNATTFHNVVSSGKYLIYLGLIASNGTYSFCLSSSSCITNRRLKEDYKANDIDLDLYLNIENDIKNKNLKESQRQTLVKTRTEFYFDVGDGEVKYTTLADLSKEYGDLISLLDDLSYKYDNSDLKWGIIKGDYVTYVGQINERGLKQGRGLLMNPKNIFAGNFINDQPNGKGCIYNYQKEKLYYCEYKNGKIIGRPISVEDEQKNIEKELKEEEDDLERMRKELERIQQEYEVKVEEEKKKEEEEKKRKEEEKKILEEEKKKKEEERKRKEEEEKRKEEEKKIMEEEKRKEEEKKKEEEQKAMDEEKKKIEEEKKRIEEEKKRIEEEKKIIEEEKKRIEEQKKKIEEEVDRQKKALDKRAKKILMDKFNKIKKDAEAKKKKEEKLKENLKQLGNLGLDNYFAEIENSSKRKQNIDVPYEEEKEESACVTCGCNIY